MNTRYGFIRDVEADLLDELAVTIKTEFGAMRFLEIGVCGAGTVRGLVARCRVIGCPITAAGVDFEERPDPNPLPGYAYYRGDCMDMWREIKDTFNFLFVDGCHCVVHSMCDFLNYSPFVEVGGYCLFHDTGLPRDGTKQGDWPQNHSYAGQPDSVLGVREGLRKTGLLQGYRSDWKLVREIASDDDGLMGMCLFKKLREL